MTGKEIDELEQIDPEERIRLLSRKDAFKLSCKHMDIIVNDLLGDDDAKLARLIRDLVAFNVDGTNDLLDNIDAQDKADRTARRLLYEDAVMFNNKWILTSWHNAKNRLGKTKQASEQADEQTTSKPRDNIYPSFEEVQEQARLNLGGVPDGDVYQIAKQWYDSETQSHWHDDHGEPVRNWRKVFERYCQKAWLKKATDNL